MMSECVIIIIARSQQLCIVGILLEAKSQLVTSGFKDLSQACYHTKKNFYNRSIAISRLSSIIIISSSSSSSIISLNVVL